MDINLKEKILNELKQIDLTNGIMDTCLEATKNLSVQERRDIIFELVKEEKIEIQRTLQLNDARFPLLIISVGGKNE